MFAVGYINVEGFSLVSREPVDFDLFCTAVEAARQNRGITLDYAAVGFSKDPMGLMDAWLDLVHFSNLTTRELALLILHAAGVSADHVRGYGQSERSINRHTRNVLMKLVA